MVQARLRRPETYIKWIQYMAWASLVLLLTMGLALVPLRWSLLILLGGAVGLLVLIRPWLGLLLIAFSVPFGSLFPLPLSGTAADLNELLLALVLAAWLARGTARRQLVIPLPPLLLPGLFLLGVYLITLLNAWSLREGLVETFKWIEALIVYLAVVALLPRRRVPWLIAALLLAGVAEALLGIYQFARAIGPSEFAILGRFVRAYGTFRQPNPFGGYLGLIAPVAISLSGWALIETWRLWHTSRRRWALARLAGLAGATGIIVLGLIVSWSRGAWLGFAAALATLVVAWGWGIIVLALLGLGTGASVILLSGYSGGRLAAALLSRMSNLMPYARFIDPRTVEITNENFPIVQRLAQWWAAWGMFRDHPWLGVGIGNYATAYPAYALPPWYLSLGHAHNYYLNAAAETGLIGLAAYLTAGLATILWLVRQVRQHTGWSRALTIGVLGVIAHLGVHNLFDNLHVQHLLFQLALLLGLLVSLSPDRGQRTSDAR